MYCPNCKSKIEHQNKRQCPECNTLLWEESGPAETAGEKSKGGLQEPDEFDQFLKDIATEVDRIVALEKGDTADSRAELDDKDQQPASVPDAVIELTDVFEHKGQETGAADRLIEKKHDIGIDILKKDQPPTQDSDEAIDLFDIIEPDVYKKDEFIEKAPNVEVESTGEHQPAVFEDSDLIEEITEQDFISADVLDLVFPDDDEPIEEITEQDFVFVEAPVHSVNEKSYLERPAKPERSSIAARIAAFMAALLIAAVFGGVFYFKTKPAAWILSPKSSTVAAKKIVKKSVTSDDATATISKGEPYFTIQVAILKDRSAAESSLAGLRGKGYAARVTAEKDANGVTGYKLSIGKYKTKAEAEQIATSYFNTEQKPYIIVRSNGEI